jgi:hypothetical protein
MALYLALGTAINNLVTLNPELANSWFANFAKYRRHSFISPLSLA